MGALVTNCEIKLVYKFQFNLYTNSTSQEREIVDAACRQPHQHHTLESCQTTQIQHSDDDWNEIY